MKKFLFGALFLLTLCFPWMAQAQLTTPYFEDFESMTAGAVPTGWDNSGSSTSTLSNNPERIWGVYSYDNNQMIRMYNYFVQSGTALINMPAITLPSTGACRLAFKYAHNATCGDFNVKISTDAGATFTTIGTYSQGASSSKEDPGAFTDVTIDLASYLGNTVTIQFFATANYTNGAIFVDDIEIGPAPTCFPPTGLAASNIASSSADFSWTASGEGEIAYEYLCIPADTTPDWTTATNVALTSASVTGLTPNTAYKFYVRSYCSATDQSKVMSVAFKTLCSPVAVENVGTISFETSEGYVVGKGKMENCWTVYNLQSPTNTNYIPYVQANGTYAGSEYAHTGTQCLNMYASFTSNADSAIAVMPDYIFTPDMSGYELHFYMRKQSTSSYYSYNDTLWVGVMSDPSDISTLQIIGSAVNTTTIYQKYIVSLSNYVGITGNIVFLAAADQNASLSYKYASFYVDDIVIVETRNTPTPTNIQVSNITMNTVDVSFTTSAPDNRILIATEPVDDPETYTNWAIDTLTSGNNPTINVQPSTKYWLFVQAIGTVDSSFISYPAVHFQSACAVISTLPWTEDFENEPVGDFGKICWFNEHVSGPGFYLAKISTSELGSNKTHKLYFKDQTATTYTSVKTPEINIPAAEAYEFQISVYRMEASSFPYEGVTVIVENNNGGNDSIFIPRDFASSGSVGAENEKNEWYTYTIPMPKAGIQRVELLGRNDYGNNIYMDNLRIRKTPTCTKVNNVIVSDNQTTQATISWDIATGSKYQVVFTSERINPDTLASVDPAKILFNDSTPAADDSLIVTGLTPATKYYVYVRGLCTDEVSDWSDYIVFRTQCAIVTVTKNAPFQYGFEDLNPNEQEIPCWEVIKHNFTSNYPSANETHHKSGERGWYYGGSNGPNDTSYLVLPEITNSVNTLRLSFYMQGFNTPQYNDSIVVGVMVDPTDETSFIAYDTIVAPDDMNWYRYEFLFDEYTGPEGRFALKRIPVLFRTTWYNQYYGSAFDDFKVDLIPTCRKVKDIVAEDITPNQATISWTATTASNYTVMLADSAINFEVFDSVALAHILSVDVTSANSIVLFDLDHMTKYYVYVQGDCGDYDFSEWSDGYVFSTMAGIPYYQGFRDPDGVFLPEEMEHYIVPTSMDSVIAGVETVTPSTTVGGYTDWYMNTFIAADTATVKLNMYGICHFRMFATPVLSYDSIENLVLSFDVCKRKYMTSDPAPDTTNTDDQFYVLVANPEMTQFTKLATWGNDNEGKCDYSLRNDIGTDFTNVVIDLSELKGDYRIVFGAGSATSDDDYDLHVDNVLIAVQAEVVALSADTTMGTVEGSCMTYVGAQVTLTATPIEGYHLLFWSDGATTNVNIHTVTSENDTVIAYFVPDTQYEVTVNIIGAGTVRGAGLYGENTTVTLVAIPQPHWSFKKWTLGDSVITSDTLTFVITDNTTVSAEFVRDHTGVEDVEDGSYVAYTEGRQIVVSGVADRTVSLFDANGRLISTVAEANADERFEVSVPGIYFVRVSGLKSTSVVVK